MHFVTSLLSVVVRARIHAVVLGLRRAAGREVARNVEVANAVLRAESQVPSRSVVAVRAVHVLRLPTTMTSSDVSLHLSASQSSLLLTAARHCQKLSSFHATFYLPFRYWNRWL